MTNRFAQLLLTLCLVSLLAQGGCEKKTARPKVVYVTNGIASFWTIVQAGVKAGGEKYNVDSDTQMPAQGIGDQKRIMEDLLTKGVDGIAISPIDPENQNDLINEAAKRTKLITNDSDAPNSNRLCYVGMDNYDAGRLAGKLVKEAMPGGGKVMILVGRLEQDNARRRRQGVIDELLDRASDPNRYDPPGKELSNDKYNVVGTLTDQFDQAKGKANAEDAISSHPDLGCMVGLFAYNPPLILQALQQAGKLGKIQVIGFDEADETLQAIKDGTCHGTVVQNPYMYGMEAVRILAALIRGDNSVIPANKIIYIPARQIRKDNVDEFWADLKKKMGK